jgi:hypothetical protein
MPVVVKLQGPGGGFVARLRNTSPGLLGNGSVAEKSLTATVTLVSGDFGTCPSGTTRMAEVYVTVLDPDGHLVMGTGPDFKQAVTLTSGSNTKLKFSPIVYDSTNCPGDEGPAPGDDAEVGSVSRLATATITEMGPDQGDSDTGNGNKSIQCKPSK